MRAVVLVLLVVLSGCAPEMEMNVEPIIEEPMMEEPSLDIDRCGDDGIGGTGCPEPAT